MTITITAFERSPDGGKGLARYARSLDAGGSGPTLRGSSCLVQGDEGTRTSGASSFRVNSDLRRRRSRLVRDGAIVLHIAQRHAGLLPDDANARARAIAWMFAALNTGGAADPRARKRQAARGRQVLVGATHALSSRIASVTGWANFPVALAMPTGSTGAFSAGDLMMVSVLLRLKASGMLDEYPNLSAYLARGEARPAYKRAFDAQPCVVTPGKRPTG